MSPATLNRRAVMQAAAAAALCRPAAAGAAPSTGDPPLHEIAANRGILFGTYIYEDLVDKSPDYMDLAAREAALVVCSAFHWRQVAPSRDRSDFAKVDAVLTWARAHELKVRGHALVWGEALPPWFEALSGRDAAVRALEDHIRLLGRRYAGQLQSWDVVNEAIKVNDGRADRLRRTPVVEKIGPDFLDISFQAARAADPKAKLVLNEFGLELDIPEHREKRRVLLGIIDGFRRRGTPIDAVGLQSHLELATMPRFDDKVFSDFLNELAARGVEIMLTELDVIDLGAPADLVKRDAEVAAAYKRYLDVALANKAVRTVIAWGLTDRHSWIDWMNPRTKRPDGLHPRPLAYDENLRPKPARTAIADALRAAPLR